jgi:N-acetylglucosamine kinase-like BadF-type ATPase
MTDNAAAAGGPTLVVGADGGNSKTDLVLADTTGRVWARVRGAGTRPQQDGLAVMIARLAALVTSAREAVTAAGLPPEARIGVAAFYLANLDTRPAEIEAYEALTALGIAEHIVVRNDTFAVLGAGRAGQGGVGVVGGAGINAVGVHPDGRTARFLALGHHTGDWGGGQSLGVATLGAAIRAGDGRGPATALREAVAAHFGRQSAEEVAIAVEERELTWQQIITLTPVLYAVAQAGDEVALSIVDRMADEVATMAIALLNRLGLAGADVPVVLGGGALQNAPDQLLDRVRGKIGEAAPRASVVVLDAPPVVGPMIDALALAGASPEAAERARAHLAADRPLQPA